MKVQRGINHDDSWQVCVTVYKLMCVYTYIISVGLILRCSSFPSMYCNQL